MSDSDPLVKKKHTKKTFKKHSSGYSLEELCLTVTGHVNTSTRVSKHHQEHKVCWQTEVLIQFTF